MNTTKLGQVFILLAHIIENGEPIESIPDDILEGLSGLLEKELERRENRSIH
tara:strand:- start:368 stop:523 length:156 start_codon:yes stop_codon:yes gene_type:complete